MERKLLVFNDKYHVCMPYTFQVGPYTFLEERAKTNVSYNSDYTVEYRQLSPYLSLGSSS